MPKAPRSRLLSKLGFATVSATAVVAPASTTAGPRATVVSDDSDVESDDDTNLLAAGQPATQVDLGHDAGSPGRGLAVALSRAPALVATELAARWAVSGDAARRFAIADALSWRFRLVGDDVVIDHLSRDSDPVIRRAAARAAWARRETGGDDHVLKRLADDPDLEVRRVACLAILR
jgi:hypothetical protein